MLATQSDSLPVRLSAKTAIFIVLLAFVVRALLIIKFPSPVLSDLNWNDAVAWNMVQGNGFTASQQAPYVPGIFRTPGYMAFIAGIYTVFGHNYVAALYGQSLLDGFSALLVALICLPFFGVRVATLAGILYALYPYSAFLCTQLAQDIVLTFTVLLCLWMITRAWSASQEPIESTSHLRPHKNALLLWFAVGLTLGIAALVKAFLLLYLLIPLATIWTLRALPKWKIKASSMIVLGLFLVVSPWIVRNYLAFRAFPPLAVGGTGTNLNLLLIEIEGGEAALVKTVKVQNTDAPVSSDHTRNYLDNFVDGKALIEKENQLTHEALPKIKARTPQYAAVILRHIPRLWITQYTLGRSSFVGLASKIVSYFVLIPGLIGMWLLRRRWRELLPFYLSVFWLTITYAPYTAEARYTLPARPVMMIFVAVALFWIWDKLRHQNTIKTTVDN